MTARQFGVVGHPISHSKSPALHRAAFESLGLDWSYSAFDVPQGELSSFLSDSQHNVSGLSVTMPHKTAAFQLATVLDETAKLTGVANTLSADGDILRPGPSARVLGYNTDVHGIVAALGDQGLQHIDSMTIIGSGSTAMSALVAAHRMGARRVNIVGRNMSAIESLVDKATQVHISAHVFDVSDMSAVEPTAVTVCTLPGSAEVSLEPLARNDTSVLLDVAYDPWPSQRATQWLSSGAIAVSGLSMLAHQALIQSRIFVNGSPDIQLPREENVRRDMFASVGLATD